MVKSPIIFGRINKRLLIPTFLSLTQIALQIVNNLYFPKKKDIVSSLYSLSIGQIIIRFLPCILKISNDEEKNEKEVKQRKCLHYFILCALFLVERGLHSGSIIAGKFLLGEAASYTDSNLFLVQDFLILSIEMAFMAIFSRFLLKYKFFKHHIISIIIFIILGIVSEIIIISGFKYTSSDYYKKYCIVYSIIHIFYFFILIYQGNLFLW